MTAYALQLGDFTCEALLGPGGVTETYRARGKAAAADHLYAVKLLRSDRGGTDPEVAAAFIQAALDLASVAASGVVRVIEVSTAHEAIFAVSDLIEGVNLARLRAGLFTAAGSGRPDAQLVGFLGAEIARCLSALHERSPAIVHGDLAPGNVIVTPEGTVVLLDAGLFAAVRPLTENPVEKWFFAAPEVVAGDSPDVLSDLYSLGAILFYLLTGRAPFFAESRDDLETQMRSGAPAMPAVAPWLADSLGKLLAADRASRPATARDAAAMLAASNWWRGRLAEGAVAAAKAPDDAAARFDEMLPAPLSEPLALVAESGDVLPAPAQLSTMPEVDSDPSDLPAVVPLELPGDRFPAGPVELSESLIGQAASEADAENFGDSMFDLSGLSKPVLLSESLPVAEASEAGDVVDIGVALRATEGIAKVEDRPSSGAGAVGAREAGVVLAPQRSAGARTPGPTPVWRPPKERGGAARKPQAGRSPKKRRELIVGAGLAALLAVGGLLYVFVFSSPPVPRIVPAPKPARVAARAPVLPAAPQQAAPVAAPRGVPGAGELKIVSTPEGATAWVDGVEKGRTPVALKTTPGGHRVVLTRPGFKMLRETVDTGPGLLLQRTLAAASAQFGGSVSMNILCQTKGKYPVFIDGRDTGLLCPVDNIKIPPGNHLIGVFVIPQNKIWSFEREVLENPPLQRVIFSY